MIIQLGLGRIRVYYLPSTLIDGSRIKVKSWTTNTATGGGCSSFSPEILINTSLDPTISLTSDAYSLTSTNSIFCEGDAITFTASSTSAIATYTFSVGGITYQSSSTNIFQPANLTPAILIPNGANVVVIATTSLGCTCLCYNINDGKCCFTRINKHHQFYNMFW